MNKLPILFGSWREESESTKISSPWSVSIFHEIGHFISKFPYEIFLDNEVEEAPNKAKND